MQTVSDALNKIAIPTGHGAKQPPSHSSVDMHNVCCLILGGGQGSRLHPLTTTRCKPAISFGGRYRLIDVPVSNAINSHIQKIFIVTQFLSSSLHRHILQTYRLDTFSAGFIEILGAEQKPEKNAWYEGTADAIRQNLEYLLETPAEYFLILSGDQLYNMPFEKMVRFAMEKEVDVTVATLAVDEKDASRMGIMKIDDNCNIVDFYEKPKEKVLLDMLKTDSKTLEKLGLPADTKREFLGSMGIYLFRRQALFDLLQEDLREDFGKHLIPTKVKKGSIAAYTHDGYWEDIGTIESFHKANIALTMKEPPFDCYDEARPIYTHRSHLPGPKIYNTEVNNSIICEGSIVEADEVTNSILGPKTVVKRGTVISDSYLMGNDFYETQIRVKGASPVRPCIEENCIIRSAIIDKNVVIGKGVQLINKSRLKTYDSKNLYIRDGIIVVPRGAIIPNGFII